MLDNFKDTDVESNYLSVIQKIESSATKSGRSLGDITLVGITKRIEKERIFPVLKVGLKNIGEVVGTEFKRKLPDIKAVSPSVVVHVVGTLQSNKVKFAVTNCDIIQSVDSLRILNAINKRASQLRKIIPILLQVDYSNYSYPKGLNLKETKKVLQTISESCVHVEAKGIMTIAPLKYETNPKILRNFFAKTHTIFQEEIKKDFEIDNPILSMGMSNDFEVAIEEGSNMVRIGTAIFGPRHI